MRPKCNTAVRVLVALLAASVWSACQPQVAWTASAPAPLLENFDAAEPSDLARALIALDQVELARGQGVDGSDAIRVWYRGNGRGSERVILNYPLAPATAYRLSYAVRFCEDFDFARGGKLHGLGPARPVAGGNRVTADRWSARAMFRRGGGLQSYVYSQNKPSRYGEGVVAKNFRFAPGRYYRLTLEVRLNDVGQANGSMRILVDGEQVLSHRNIRFRSSDAEGALINTLMFNTFHGGHDPQWAPRDARGRFAKVCAYFDDLLAAPLAKP